MTGQVGMKFIITAHEFQTAVGGQMIEEFEFRVTFDAESPRLDREAVEKLRRAYETRTPIEITVGELAASPFERAP